MSNVYNPIQVKLSNEIKKIPRSLERQYGGIIFFTDDKKEEIAEVRERLVSVDLSYTSNMASQLNFSVLDEELRMLSNNYFKIGRVIAYMSETFGTIEKTTRADIAERQLQLFEIANIGVSQGPGENPLITVTCYSRAVQQMRRDRTPGTIGGSGTEFVKRAAKKYGLKFWGEATSKPKKINKASSGNKSESLWDVINSLATDAKFVVYEVDGYLIFASEKFILKRWGTHEAPLTAAQIKSKDKKEKTKNKYIPLTWTNKKLGSLFNSAREINREELQLMEIPSISISDNNPWEASGTARIERFNAVRLRPGMTIKLGGLSEYDGYYLISEVSFPDMSPEPVTISFKKPDKQPKDIRDLAIGAKGPQVIDIGDQVGIDGRNRAYDATVVGAKFFKRRTAKGIFPLPDAENRLRYPTPSTGVFATGNIDLFERPVLPFESDVATTSAIIFYGNGAGENNLKKFALVLSTMWTVGGQPTQLNIGQTLTKYENDGKFLAKVRGKTEEEARARALVYINAIYEQQFEILLKKFPNGKYVSTPGSETYVIP